MSARFCCGLAFLTLAACSTSPDMHYYTLSAQPTTDSATKIPASDPRYAIDRVEIPDLLDRPQIVLRGGPNGVDVLEYHRWAAPLPDLLQRALAADLASRLGAGAIIDPGLVGATVQSDVSRSAFSNSMPLQAGKLCSMHRGRFAMRMADLPAAGYRPTGLATSRRRAAAMRDLPSRR